MLSHPLKEVKLITVELLEIVMLLISVHSANAELPISLTEEGIDILVKLEQL